MFTPENILNIYYRNQGSIHEAKQMILPNIKFDNLNRIHNWHNYIPDDLQAVWAQLSEETRAALFVVAQLLADNEEWE